MLPSNPTFPGGLSIVSGIHKVLADTESPHRLTFLDTFHRDRPEVLRRDAQAIHAALDGGAAGLIWWCYGDEQMVRDLMRRYPQTVIVFIDRHPHGLDCDFVGIDDVESSRTAVDFLIDQGHTHIAHLMDPGSYSTILERAQGYRAAHAVRGLGYTPRLAFISYSAFGNPPGERGEKVREAVAMMDRIIRRVEREALYRTILDAEHPTADATEADAITAAARSIAR